LEHTQHEESLFARRQAVAVRVGEMNEREPPEEVRLDFFETRSVGRARNHAPLVGREIERGGDGTRAENGTNDIGVEVTERVRERPTDSFDEPVRMTVVECFSTLGERCEHEYRVFAAAVVA